MTAATLVLAALFFGAALVYASVGFGGGSAYLALLTLWGWPAADVPTVALVCNLVVVTGGSWHFARAGHVRLRLLAPFLLTSVPAAALGGAAHVPAEALRVVTGVSLALAALALAVRVRQRETVPVEAIPAGRLWGGGAAAGALLGGLAGVVGIGGGIFLAPVLYALGWGTPKQIAATASGFILVNSAAGLAGKAAALGGLDVARFWPLALAVIAGGQIGSRLGARRWSPGVVRRVTAAVVFVAAVNLLLG
ncbi:MAG TPA: sulfite exporter TauE/SafE family protein [Rubricoccaceae bacterium]